MYVLDRLLRDNREDHSLTEMHVQMAVISLHFDSTSI